MKQIKQNIFIATVIAYTLGISVAIADDAEKAWSIDSTAGVYTDYMFRGFNLYDGTSIQPAINANYKTEIGTFTAGLWMHLSAEGDRQEEKFFEMDETIKYTNSVGPVTFSVGNIWYSYPRSSDDITDTAEVFATVAYDTLLTPTLAFYHDWDEFDAQYYELGFSHKVTWDALGEGFNMTPYTTFGFASSSEGVYDDDGLEHVTIGSSFALSLGDVSVTPSVNYTFKVDDATVNEFWTGLSFSYSI